MMKWLLFLVLIVTIQSSIAQTPDYDWAYTYGSASSDACTDVAADSAGNSYACGNFHDTISFGAYTFMVTGQEYDIFFAKFDPEGQVVWAKHIGGDDADYVTSIHVDRSGNVYVTGAYSDTVAFDSTILVSQGSINYFVAKFDNQGTNIWVQTSTTMNTSGMRVITDATGNVYVTGTYEYTSTFGTIVLPNFNGGTDIFTAKYDASGNLLWVKGCGGAETDIPSDIAVDQQGNVFIAGKSQFNFNFGSQSWNTWTIIFIGKFDANGNYLWAKVGENGFTTINLDGFGVDDAGNTYSSLWIHSQFQFDSVTYYNNSHGVTLMKTDNQGNVLWMKPVSTTSLLNLSGASLEVSASGDCYFSGIFRDTLIIGSSSFLIPGPNSWSFVAKTDSSGNGKWAQVSSAHHGVTKCAYDDAGLVYFGGNFYDTASCGTYSFTSSGYEDFFIAKLLPLDVGFDENSLQNTAVIYPNPFRNSFSISIPAYAKKMDCNVRTVLGQIVFHRNGKEIESIDLSFLPDGIYFLELNIDDVPVTRKLVKQ